MKLHLLLPRIILYVCPLLSVSGVCQSVVIEPGRQGFNTGNAQNNTLEIQGDGILIQAPYSVSTVNPQSTIVIVPNGSSITCTAEAGILKDPNGDNPYLTGTAYNATAYLNLPSGIGIKFTFDLLDTEANGDSVIISDFENVQIARYSGNSIPPELIVFSETSFTNKYYVRFKTNNNANNGQGFELRWQTLFSNGTASDLTNIAGGSSMIFDRNRAAFRAGQFSKHNLKTIGQYSSSFGERTEASGNHSFAGGNRSKATGSAAFAFGSNSEASEYAYSLGYFTKAKGYDAFVTGSFNDISNSENNGGPTDRLFQIGNGTTEANRKNAITILRNGRMGIETSNPAARLHVFSGSSGVSFTTNSTAIFENNTSHYLSLATPEASESGILFSKSGTGAASGGIIYGTNNALSFRNNGNITRMTIGSNGKVGIGVVNPLKTLDIASPATESAELQLSSTGSRFTTLRLKSESGSSEVILEKGTDMWSFTNVGNRLLLNYDGDVAAGTIYALSIGVSSEPSTSFKYYTIAPVYQNYTQLGNSANRFREIWSTNPLNTSSDRRLKKDIISLAYGLEEVLQLKPVSYHWKNHTDTKLHLGFIAQDVEKLIPEIVTSSGLSDEEFLKLDKSDEKISDTYGMEYNGLIPVLVRAIQQQQTMIEHSSAEILKLKAEVSQSAARLKAIEAYLSSQKSVESIKSADK